jgi:enoyl-CoA hydratase/carnithine racemase
MTDLKTTFKSLIGVMHVEFNRPSTLNSLSPDLLHELIDLCNFIKNDDDIRVVVLEGSEENFSSGADLPSFQKILVSDPREAADLGRVATETLSSLPQITIAAIQGHCIGGAMVLASACDIRIASENSSFFIPELDAGIPLTWGGLDYLVRLVGFSFATDLVTTCRKFDANEAYDIGFISRVIKNEDFKKESAGLARIIGKKPEMALKITKQQLISIRNGNYNSKEDGELMLKSLASPEDKEANKKYVKKLS